MRSPILALLLALTCVKGWAQKIHFTDSSNHWVTAAIAGMEGSVVSITYQYGADTTIGTNTYRHFDISTYHSYFVREDTAAGIVYYRWPELDTLEHVLYNYNLQVGDTLAFSFPLSSFVAYDTVVQVDTLILDGQPYRRLVMQNAPADNAPRAYCVVEGMGTTNNPVWPAYFPGCFEYDEKLRCFSNDTGMPQFKAWYFLCSAYTIDPTWFVNCDPNAVGTVRVTNDRIIVSPNPSADVITVNLGERLKDDARIYLYNTLGAPVFTSAMRKEASSVQIPVGNLPGAVYELVIRNASSILARERVVVVH